MTRTAYPNDYRRHYDKSPDLVRLFGIDQTARSLPTKLLPGRYTVTVHARAASERIWLRFGPHGAVQAAATPAAPAAGDEVGDNVVFIGAAQTSLTVHVRPGVNDGVSALIDSGVATRSLAFTRIAK